MKLKRALPILPVAPPYKPSLIAYHDQALHSFDLAHHHFTIARKVQTPAVDSTAGCPAIQVTRPQFPHFNHCVVDCSVRVLGIGSPSIGLLSQLGLVVLGRLSAADVRYTDWGDRCPVQDVRLPSGLPSLHSMIVAVISCRGPQRIILLML